MAQLPYTITICPDEPNPKQFTAMTPQLINAMRFGYDMTIDQRQSVWPAGGKGATQINNHKEKKPEPDIDWAYERREEARLDAMFEARYSEED